MENLKNKFQREISLIISAYNQYDYLYLVLKSIENQTFKNFEVIIAEDCQKSEMKKNIDNWKKEFSFPLFHVFQEDIGFRKTKILNSAIRESNGRNIVIIDQDCILHKEFLQNYIKNFNKGYDVIFGRRCEMSEKLSKKLLKNQNYKIKLTDLIFPYSKAWTECIYFPFFFSLKKRRLRLLGSNMGFTKEAIYKINGFNEAYTGAGIGEDTDLEWRFLKAGVKYKASKNEIIQYHIFHGRENRENNLLGEKILKESKEKNEWFCKNGLKGEKNEF